MDEPSTEAYLARAHHHVKRGDWRAALREVALVDGDAAAILVDWCEAARSRLLVEQALRMIGAHVTTWPPLHVNTELSPSYFSHFTPKRE